MPDDFAAGAAMALHKYPAKEVLRGPFALDEWRSDVVEECTPESSRGLSRCASGTSRSSRPRTASSSSPATA